MLLNYGSTLHAFMCDHFLSILFQRKFSARANNYIYETDRLFVLIDLLP